MYTPSRYYLDCYIAGFKYWDGLDSIGGLIEGTDVELRGEPVNPYDPEAVAIYYGETKLGYVPRDENSDISRILYFGHGDIFESKISAVFPNNSLERRFRIIIKIKNARGGEGK